MPETFSAPTLNADGTFTWSGQDWIIKDYPTTGEKLGPGPNFWEPDNVLVGDEGSLKLKVTQDVDLNWLSAEIQTTARLGYGTYEFQVASPLTHDKNLCLAMFTYDEDDETNAYEEWDIEFSTFNDSNPVDVPSGQLENGIFVNPNSPTPGNGGSDYWMRTYYDGTEVNTRHSINWTPRATEFVSESDDRATEYLTWKTNVDHYPYEDATLVINYWSVGGNAPSDGLPDEKIITSFTFTPHVRYPPSMLSKSVTANTGDTLIHSAAGSASRPTIVVVKAPSSNTNPVFVGGVDSSDRVFQIAAGESITIPMISGDTIYCHVASGTEALEVLWNN